MASDSTSGRQPNRLIHSTSPYLRQHAYNPVDWQPWGEEALARARREDRPIFLSVGYSSCHWCHVMERESFESEAIARALNENFVCIKVDREERPDIDEIYMNAVQAMTGQGGWPMSVFLLPDLRPFFGGTYFPPDDRYGRPGFLRLVMAIADSYRERRAELEESAGRLTNFLQEHALSGGGEGALDASLVGAAATQLVARVDPVYGGFGGAPKFPQPMSLSLLLRLHARAPNARYAHAVRLTLDRMARGGMYDHLAGGFHRYSVDQRWLVPHFEKMLYDNALLARTYLEAHQVFAEPFYRRVACQILDYVLREMTSDEGGFYSATDADSEGIEGKFFVWGPGEIVSVLGAEDGELFCRFYDVTDQGNWEGRSILHVDRPPAEFAAAEGVDVGELEERLTRARARLLAHREGRVHPFLDDKVITSWNALMIGSLARAYRVTDDARYRLAAERAAQLIFDELADGDRLHRTRFRGESRLDAYLEDYAFLADAVIDLYEATFDVAWIRQAQRLIDVLNRHFWDEREGGYFFTADDHEELLTRSKNLFDSAIPGGNSMAVMALVRLARLTGDPTHHERAEAVLRHARPWLERAPSGFGQLLQGLDFFLQPSREVVVAGGLSDPATRAMTAVLGRTFLPDAVVAHADPEAASEVADAIPLIAGKAPVGGKPAAYVCQNFACRAPVTSADDLSSALERDAPRGVGD